MNAPGEAAVRLLLDILDQARPGLAGPVLHDVFPNEGKALIAAGLLVADGYERFDRSDDGDDEPVEVQPADDGQYEFSHSARGLVPVSSERLIRYRAEPQAIAKALLGFTQKKAFAIRGEANDAIWDLGEIRIPNRRQLVPTVLARRIHVSEGWREARTWLINNPAPRLRLVLSSAPSKRLPRDAPHNSQVLSLRDLVGRDGTLQLDRSVLAVRLDNRAVEPDRNESLVVAADGHEVILNGHVYRLRGVEQRRIVQKLYAHYLEGEQKVAVARLVEALDLRDGARIRDFFKAANPPLMNQLLWEEGGMCGFCLEP